MFFCHALAINYREVATRTAHSLETDLWSLGCMFYTMLVGKPPFDTEGAHPTLQRVIAGDYELPSHISDTASNLIQVRRFSQGMSTILHKCMLASSEFVKTLFNLAGIAVLIICSLNAAIIWLSTA